MVIYMREYIAPGRNNKMLKKSLLGILCLIFLWQGTAYASSGETGKNINGLDLSFQTTTEAEIRVSEALKEKKMILN